MTKVATTNVALEMIHNAYLRDVSLVELVRAAAACARAVAHLASNDTKTVLAAIEAAERWTCEPTESNAHAAFLAEQQCLELKTLKTDWDEVADHSAIWAILAALYAAMACVTEMKLDELPIELSVEFASNAAAGRNIDLATVVTAVLL